jgi:hypothetical protein
MIPPDLMRQAREAFTDGGGDHAGLERALSVLSAAWPVADGLREAAERVLAHRVGDLPTTGYLRDNDASRAALADLAAATSFNAREVLALH